MERLETVSAHVLQGGALWALKRQAGVLDDVVVTANLHQERVSHRPFGEPDRRSAFTPEHVAIRGRGFGLLGLVDRIGDLVSSVVVGILFTVTDPAWGFLYAAALANIGAVVLAVRGSPH